MFIGAGEKGKGKGRRTGTPVPFPETRPGQAASQTNKQTNGPSPLNSGPKPFQSHFLISSGGSTRAGHTGRRPFRPPFPH